MISISSLLFGNLSYSFPMFDANLSFRVMSVDIGKWFIFWYSRRFSKNWYLFVWLLMLPSQHTEKALDSVYLKSLYSRVNLTRRVSLFTILNKIVEELEFEVWMREPPVSKYCAFWRLLLLVIKPKAWGALYLFKVGKWTMAVVLLFPVGEISLYNLALSCRSASMYSS